MTTELPLTLLVLLMLAAAAVSAVAAGFWFTSRNRRKVGYMLDALEDNEMNFRFKEKGLLNRSFNRMLNRMKRIFEKEKRQLLEQEEYFGAMLDKVSTGVIAVDSEDGHVAYSNAAALRILGISSLVNLKQLGNISFLPVSRRQRRQGGLHQRHVTALDSPQILIGDNRREKGLDNLLQRHQQRAERNRDRIVDQADTRAHT